MFYCFVLFGVYLLQFNGLNAFEACHTISYGIGKCTEPIDCPFNIDSDEEECENETQVCCPLGRRKNKRPVDLLPSRSVCGIQSSDRIIGGSITDIDEHPWLALIEYKKFSVSGHFCAGALISARYVLTAAHCVASEDLPSNWKLEAIRLGEWNTTSVIDCHNGDCAPPVQDIKISESYIHERYNRIKGQAHHDIALIKLAKDAIFNDFVKPICLPLSIDCKNYKGLMAEVAGWGRTEKAPTSKIKLKVKVPINNNQKCAVTYKSANRDITHNQLCAGGLKGKDSCTGDSGGPLMANIDGKNWVVIGIVSYGPNPCGDESWPGVYTRVDAYLNWIRSKIKV